MFQPPRLSFVSKFLLLCSACIFRSLLSGLVLYGDSPVRGAVGGESGAAVVIGAAVGVGVIV